MKHFSLVVPFLHFISEIMVHQSNDLWHQWHPFFLRIQLRMWLEGN